MPGRTGDATLLPPPPLTDEISTLHDRGSGRRLDQVSPTVLLGAMRRDIARRGATVPATDSVPFLKAR